jgi:hypothetical protein
VQGRKHNGYGDDDGMNVGINGMVAVVVEVVVTCGGVRKKRQECRNAGGR